MTSVWSVLCFRTSGEKVFRPEHLWNIIALHINAVWLQILHLLKNALSCDLVVALSHIAILNLSEILVQPCCSVKIEI